MLRKAPDPPPPQGLARASVGMPRADAEPVAESLRIAPESGGIHHPPGRGSR